jgi:hypothetical protein
MMVPELPVYWRTIGLLALPPSGGASLLIMFTSRCSWVVRIEQEDRPTTQYRAQGRVLPPMLRPQRPDASKGLQVSRARMLTVAAREPRR